LTFQGSHTDRDHHVISGPPRLLKKAQCVRVPVGGVAQERAGQVRVGRCPSSVEDEPLVETEEAVDVPGDLGDVRVHPGQGFGVPHRVKQVQRFAVDCLVRERSIDAGGRWGVSA
jgi:hypothetical protein